MASNNLLNPGVQQATQPNDILLCYRKIMKQIRHHFFTRFLCGLAAVVILNMSVDAPDLHDNSIPEDLSYNDIESVVEWMLEDVFAISDAIPEHDDNDSSDPTKLDKKVELFYENISLNISAPTNADYNHIRNFEDQRLYSQSALDELIQPPEA